MKIETTEAAQEEAIRYAKEELGWDDASVLTWETTMEGWSMKLAVKHADTGMVMARRVFVSRSSGARDV